MTPPIEERFSPKWVSIALVAAWVISVAATLTIGNFWIALVSIFFNGALPFALLAIWIPRSRVGKFFQEAASVWQLRIFGISAVFAYSLYAHKWAGDVINELFHVDSSHFGVTTTVLTVLFAPFGLVYRQDVIDWLWIAFILVVTLLSCALPLSLLTPDRPALGWKAWVGSLLLVLFGTFVLTMSAHLAKQFNPLAMRFAIWADFNESHLCANDWTNKPNSVVFLGDQRVLVYFPENPAGNRFSVEPCNYEKRF